MKHTYEIKDVAGRIVQTIKSESPLVMEEEKEKELNFSHLKNKLDIIARCPIFVRSEGEYKNKGFYLSALYDWEIRRDNFNFNVLVPTLKK